MDTPIKPNSIYLKDYAPPDFLVDTVALVFELDPQETVVHARLAMRQNPGKVYTTPPPLRLEGHALTLCTIALDGIPLPAYRFRIHDTHLIVPHVPDAFVVTLTTRIHPAANTSLEGLYQSGALLCTQCEAEGFRKMTYYPDRPDIMARFVTTLIADKTRFPTLLSNGNQAPWADAHPPERHALIRAATTPGKHAVTWVDPHPKPSYLFALVAGKLACHRDVFTFQAGQKVDLEIYVESQQDAVSKDHDTLTPTAQKCLHAMAALKKAMAWDEKEFGRLYDLDTYRIVAVNDFNMGAMENKGLNIFNAQYVLADQETATDQDFQRIEWIIAHEYFHNWTGNRITCRDWFQLSLKEGLTVFRDQEFSAETTSPAVQRIQDVRLIRTHQFAEDSGPTAHPVQPDSYMEINNFYTLTVYDKGAEVVRMLHTLLGAHAFRKGMDLYFERHDGQAVTVEAFIQAMETASGRDLRPFLRWYQQAGTPVLSVTTHHNAETQTLHLHVQQTCPPTPGQTEKAPFHIPLTVGLLDASSGQALPLILSGEKKADTTPSGATSRVLEICHPEEHFTFTNLPHRPVPSLLRHFSAPVRLQTNLSDTDLVFLWAHDSDPFNRWNAGQTLASNALLRLASDFQANRPLTLEETFVHSFAQVLRSKTLDPATTALILTLPSELSLMEQMQPADPQAVHAAHLFLRTTLAHHLHELLKETYLFHAKQETTHTPSAAYDPLRAGKRALKNLCLALLATQQDPDVWQRARHQFETTDNMTDRMAALTTLLHANSQDAENTLTLFEKRWENDALVMNKWFAIQATIPAETTLNRVRRLQKHPLFSLQNPNRVRALLNAFCHGNPFSFHQPSGEGYTFLVAQVLALDPINPQVAARLVAALVPWKKLEPGRREKMRAALQTIQQTPTLSRDVFEVVSKSLA